MPDPSIELPLFPSMYALMIFFAVSVVGIIMGIKNRQTRLKSGKVRVKREEDKLREIIADEKKLQESKMRPDVDQGSPQPYPQIDKDDLMKGEIEALKKQFNEEKDD